MTGLPVLSEQRSAVCQLRESISAQCWAAYERLTRRNPQHRDNYEKKLKEKLSALSASSAPGQPALESVEASARLWPCAAPWAGRRS
jgi:hypothetical protein